MEKPTSEFIKLEFGGFYRKGHYAVYENPDGLCTYDCYSLKDILTEEQMLKVAECIIGAYREGKADKETEIQKRINKLFGFKNGFE